GALEAPNADVRSHALGRLPSLYEQGSLEPFLIALRSRFSDVRLAVVNRLVGSQDDRVADALGKAMESEHEDLQLRAAEVLAARGDRRTLDILAGMLRSENAKVVGDAGQALVRLSQSNDVPESARSDLRADVAAAFIARMEDDPDGTANKKVILDSLSRVGSTAALPALMSLLTGEDANLRRQALRTAIAIGSFGRAARVSDKGIKRASYDEAFVLSAIEVASSSVDAALRLDSVAPLQDIDDASADALLAALVDDRDEQVRIKAVRVLAHRSQHAPEPKPATETLAAVLREGKRELVLPAAQGLAKQGRREAFQPLVLVLKAGENPERQAAVLSLGNLGDPRGLEELEPLAFPSEELEPEDKLLVPFAVEALGRMIPRLEGEEQTRVRDAIETTAKESSPGMRMRALSGLAAAGNERSRALLRQLLGDRYEENSVRIHCAKMLGELTDSDSEEVLADALRVNNHQLRQQALKSLRGIFPQDETRVSLLALQSPYSDISAPAAQFLAREGDADTLITRLADIKNPDVRIRLRKGLIRRGLAPVAAIAKLLETAPAGPRTDAAWLAFETKAPELAAPLRVALERCVKELQEVGKESEAERVGATRAVLAAGVRLEANLDPARELLTHRVLGGEAFAALLERGAISDDELVAALSAPQFRQRWIAARALAAKSPERSAAILQSLAAPSASGVAPLAKAAVAHDAAQVLSDAKLRGIALPTMLQDARSPLVDRALAKDSEGREIAIAALGRAGDQDAVDALKSILARPDEADEIRAAAYKALRKVERRRARNARFEEEQA
ncbi:MAG: HEAT repeat domain-containing protein, partial [Myxococcota bacterium]